MCVDTRGFDPKDLKINVTRDLIEIQAEQQMLPIGTESNYTQRNYAMSRNFHLPQSVIPELAQCQFATNGSGIIIRAPWANR